MRKIFGAITWLTVTFGITLLAFSYGRGPVNKKTGAPGEGICVQSKCHVEYEVNSGPGSLLFLGIPAVYQPGELYPLTVQLEQKGQKRWGFQVTVIDSALDKSGEIVKYDDELMQLDDDEVDGHERYYLKHTRDGTYRGTKDGPVTWKFTWRAPMKAQGVISFYLAANAGNGNRKPTGDYIYQTVQQSYPDSTVFRNATSQ